MWSADGSGRSAATLTSSPKPSRRPVGSWITAWFWAWQLAGSTFHTRRRLFEQLPRYRAGLAQRLIELPHAARAVGVLVAVFYIGVRLNDLDPVPVGFEFVGQHHRQTCLDAGAHLGAVGDDRHQPGFIDADIHIRCEPG